uniref:ShKT domain-containing protein n=1 Tax=Heligmosomoides polygyrus TaxID=6339 RepID=A0A183G081_HELPZ
LGWVAITTYKANGLISGGSAAENRFGVVKATKTPCCVDTLLPGVCRALYNRNHVQFTTRCRTLPDFSFIQCCHSCHFNDNLYTGKGLPVATDLYRRDAEEMLLKPDTFKCFDRHGSQFCEAFAAKLSSWTRTGFTCQHTALAFRICRRTCGYCSGQIFTPLLDGQFVFYPSL